MQIKIKPLFKPCVDIQIPSSKSMSNRALIMNYLANGSIRIEDLSKAKDTLILKRILTELPDVIDVGDAGTVFRFLTALACIIPGERVITGSPRLQERPIDKLVEALNSIGADVQYQNNTGFAPLKIKGNSQIVGGKVKINASISSQFLSALMLIAPYLQSGLILELVDKPVSFSFVELTAQMMRSLGTEVEIMPDKIVVPAAPYKGGIVAIEGDFASASYWYSLILLLPRNYKIRFQNLSLNSVQPDRAVIDIFGKLGVKTSLENNHLVIFKENDMNHIRDLNLDFSNCPDLAQTLAVCVSALDIDCILTGLSTLEYKESKRLTALKTELSKFGKNVEIINNETLKITGKISWKNNMLVCCHGDHRMAMSFAPLIAIVKSLTFDDGSVVNKSYPLFWNEIEKFAEIIN